MLLDNERDLIEIYPRELRKYGLDVHGFTDPVAALKDFRSRPEDYVLVVSDIRMPKMSGFEFARNLKEIQPAAKVVFITAFEINMSEFTRVLPSIKIEGFIKKPITPSKLAETIKGFLKTEPDIELD